MTRVGEKTVDRFRQQLPQGEAVFGDQPAAVQRVGGEYVGLVPGAQCVTDGRVEFGPGEYCEFRCAGGCRLWGGRVAGSS